MKSRIFCCLDTGNAETRHKQPQRGAKVSLRSSRSLRLNKTTAKGAKGRKGSSPSASFAPLAVKQNNRKGRIPPNPLKGAYFSTAKTAKGAKVSPAPSAFFALSAVKPNNRKGRKGAQRLLSLCALGG